MKIKKGDQVEVVSGKYRGKRGKVLRTLPSLEKIVVEKVNIVIKHIRPKRQGEKGQRVELLAPFPVSNVMLVCPHTDKRTRIAYKILKDGSKVRVSKKSGKEI